MRLESLPLTANGKLDRASLPAPDAAALALRAYEAPEGLFEQTLAQIWQELLQVERVGRHDNFFELGGHSLLAVQVYARVHKVLGRELLLMDLFESPTIAGVGRKLQAQQQSWLPPIERVSRESELLLSYAQQRLWFIDQLEGGGAAYHIAGAVRLQGEVDEVALRRALDALVLRHESLRTTWTCAAWMRWRVKRR
jgi:hypothetical protein